MYLEVDGNWDGEEILGQVGFLLWRREELIEW